jgi:hypothetical protein
MYSENTLDALVYYSFSKKYSIFTSTEVMVLESRLAFKGRKNNFPSVTTTGRWKSPADENFCDEYFCIQPI